MQTGRFLLLGRDIREIGAVIVAVAKSIGSGGK